MKIWPMTEIIADPRINVAYVLEFTYAAQNIRPSLSAMRAVSQIVEEYRPCETPTVYTLYAAAPMFLRYLNRPTVEDFARLERTSFINVDGDFGLTVQTLQ